jgi:hypothetical protein
MWRMVRAPTRSSPDRSGAVAREGIGSVRRSDSNAWSSHKTRRSSPEGSGRGLPEVAIERWDGYQ